jgi:hypothetical protein
MPDEKAAAVYLFIAMDAYMDCSDPVRCRFRSRSSVMAVKRTWLRRSAPISGSDDTYSFAYFQRKRFSTMTIFLGRVSEQAVSV